MPDLKRFYDDPGVDRLTTRVVARGTDGGTPWARLDETIFYPEGGGQPADHGWIGDARVLDVIARGNEVVHRLDREVGEGPVEIRLDAARRFDHCQQHTAQHLLTAVLVDRHGLPTTSFHLGADTTAIEVRGAVPSARALREYEAEINAHLREDRRVVTRWVAERELPELNVRSRGLPDGHTGPVRLVEIEGLDLNTCGGTHVGRLGEIQAIEILDAEAARGGARIRFLAGGRVFAGIRRMREVEEALKARIGVAPAEFAGVLDGWDSERRRLDRRVRALEGELAEALAAGLAADPSPILCAVLPGAAPDGLRALAAAALARRPEAVVVLAGDGGEAGGACFLVQAGPEGAEDVAILGARVREAIGAKGGGRGRTFQGKGGSLPSLEVLRKAAEASA
jgi:alanyl-tRNA synthetase